VIFGGANCEGEMGLQLIQSFPWIDYVCCGEADVSFPALLDQLVRAAPSAPVAGVLKRGECDAATRSEAIQDMNRLPMPDFDDYYADLLGSPLPENMPPHLILETSRGCWWGAKHHCTFCGLNGDTMAFRSKTPDRAFAEMEYLSQRYDTRRIGCVDNILDLRYIDTLFPRLADSGLELELFYEVKANLRYDQLVKLRRGGMRQIQPGIESFSDQVLRLMEKGCTGFQNIQLLRWCEELGIDAAWNLLSGFPGESPAEYERMAELIPLLTHLNPPCSCAQVRLDRFSPFHFRAEDFGFQRLRPARAYFFVFPLGRKELARLAYFFDFDYGDGRQPGVYLEPVQREVRRWWEGRTAPEGERPKLDARFDGERVELIDTRSIAHAPRYELTGVAARVYELCDAAATLSSLLRHPELADKEGEVRAALSFLTEHRLVAEIEEKYLSLAVFRQRPPVPTNERIDAYLTVPQAAPAQPLLHLV
jgi:ribosomal peptide maturation radical SAM protein 1